MVRSTGVNLADSPEPATFSCTDSTCQAKLCFVNFKNFTLVGSPRGNLADFPEPARISNAEIMPEITTVIKNLPGLRGIWQALFL